MLKIRPIVLNSILLLVSLLAGFLIVEVSLRLLPRSITAVSSGVEYEKDEHIGYKLKPNSISHSISGCFEADVTANSFGFRGEEWILQSDIAILGDSYMEAIQVDDDETTAEQVSSLLNVSVYNAGLSSFGTVAEFLTYETYLKKFKPKIVVLVMYENDILDNHCSISDVGDERVSKPCVNMKENSFSINKNYYSNSGNTTLRSFVKKYCVTCNMARRFFIQIKNKEDTGVVETNDDNQKIISEAWKITDFFITELNSTIANNGGKLIVMVIPNQLTYYASSTEELMSDKIVQLVKEKNIPVIDLAVPMKEYVSNFSLSEPFFSYPCDGHWNPLGHYIAARVLSKYLVDNDLVTRGPSVKESIIRKIDEELRQPPMTIIGVEKFGEIYGGL